MSRLLSAAMIAATVLGTAPLAHAVSVLVSAPMRRGGVPFTCNIANAGKTTVIGTIESVDANGNTAAGPTAFTLDPGRSTGAGFVLANSGLPLLYCRFTLTKGSKNAVRAQACVFSSVDTSGPCLSTAEAR